MRKLVVPDKRLILQFIFVFFAFFLIIILSGIFNSDIISKKLTSQGNEDLNSTAETIRTCIHEAQTTLESIGYFIERIKYEGKEPSEIQEEMVLWSKWVAEGKSRFGDFETLYGVIDEEFVNGENWEPENYNPKKRPWYIGAMQKKGEIFFSTPYIDAHTGKYVLTLSKLLFDKNKKVFGIVALDADITNIFKSLGESAQMSNGYGMLINEEMIIVMHKEESLWGKKIHALGDTDYLVIANRIASGQNISAYPIIDYDGTESIAFFKEVYNGWYVGAISPQASYFSDVTKMRWIMSLVGFTLMLILCALLYIMYVARVRSDEANKIKSSFLANMSHEIRTPMNAITGMSELLLNEPLNERQKRYLSDIKVSSDALLSIINDILDLSKIEEGKVALNPVDYDFTALLDNVCSIFEFVAQNKGIEFRYEAIGNLPKYLHGDDVKVRQVLTNVCSNAVKFTDEGYVHFKVWVGEEDIHFEVTDTGIGIVKEDIKRVFDPFAQAESRKTRNIVGTGLGLSISKSFVEMMGGTIQIDSEYGVGTVLYITIPKVIGDENAVEKKLRKSIRKAFAAPSAKVLVVDDNEINLKVAKGLLNLYEINADTVISGKEALQMIEQTHYDIIFMDHMMPEMDGIEVTERIRSLGGVYKEITIVALTANVVHGAKEMFLLNGMDGFVKKPIEIEELEEVLLEKIPEEKMEYRIMETSDENDEAEKPFSCNKAEGEFLIRMKKIRCINTEIGLERVSCMEDMYHDTVKLFYEKLLTDCDTMEQMFRNKDIKNLGTMIHGMKSSLATIGVMELSQNAYHLEMALYDKNLSYCAEYLPVFLESLRKFNQELAGLFKDEIEKEEMVDRLPGSIEILRESEGKLRAAIEDLDDDLGVEVLEELLSYDFGTQANAVLKKLNSAFKNFDFGAAAELLEQIHFLSE